jgi:methionine biosynthesis protein MetW
VRRAMLFTGQAPKTKMFPYDWYNSPNIHFLSINDFEDLCKESDFPIETRYFLSGASRITFLPNLRAQTAVFLLG